MIFFLVAAVAGLLAYRAVQAGSPPVPELAIEEAKRIRQTLEAGTTPAAKEPTEPAAARDAAADSRRRRGRAVSTEPELYSGAGEPVARAAAGPVRRSSAEIRADIERQREELCTRSRRFAAGSPSSPTGAARSASTAAS